ncbi:MAG: NAD(P)H-binding protein [Arthrobacter sp.]
MTHKNKTRVLMTGATGTQGGAVVQALRGDHSVTAFVRNPESVPAQAPLKAPCRGLLTFSADDF